jgi:hypothetical protein
MGSTQVNSNRIALVTTREAGLRSPGLQLSAQHSIEASHHYVAHAAGGGAICFQDRTTHKIPPQVWVLGYINCFSSHARRR